MGKADLHMHSTYSDGYQTVANILNYVERATDLDVIAITDHDCIDGALLARDLVTKFERLEIIVGVEISTAEGHLLALDIEQLIPAGLSMEETICAVHEQGGLAIVAHPLCRWCPSANLDTLTSFIHMPDGLEVHNASFAGIGTSTKVRRLNQMQFGWAELGGSDAHSLSAIGSSFTTFPGHSAQDVLAAIRSCETIAYGKRWPKKAISYYTYRKVRSHLPTPRAVGRSVGKRVRARIRRTA